MIGEVDIYGVFVPALALWMLAAFAVSIPLRRLLQAVGVYRLVWHRPLFDLSVYVVLVGGMVAFLDRILP